MRWRQGLVFCAVSLLLLSGAAVGAPSPVSVHFTAAGDVGMSASTTGGVLDALAAADPDAHFALGDLSYGTTGQEQVWCDFVKGRVGEGFPFELLTGNHESNGLNGNINDFSACLPNQLPGMVGTYGRQYYVDVPQDDPLVRFVMISPALPFPDGTTWTYPAGSARFNWTAAAVDGARTADIPWVVVGMHKPCLSMGVYGCDVGAGLINMLLAKKVDVVLSGHEHMYQRTKQIGLGDGCAGLAINSYDADCVVDEDSSLVAGAGTVFATIGTGGVTPLRDVNTSDTEAGYFAAVSGANQNPVHGFGDFRVTPDELRMSLVPTTGTFTDTFTLTRGAPPPNQPPTAAFTPAADGMTVGFDGTASSDPDGTVSSYAWAFGDGTTGTGANPTHTYADPGTYDVTLTVTDDDGATASATQQVSVTAQQVVAADQFERSLVNTWGSADVGGPWTVSTSNGVSSVSGGKGRSVMAAAGRGPVSTLDSVNVRDVDISFEYSLDKVPAGTNAQVDHTVYVRRASAGDYRAMVRVRSSGAVSAFFVRNLAGSGTSGVGGQVTVPGLTYAAGDTLNVRVRASGASPTNLLLKVWRLGAAEPVAWTVSRTDTTSALQGPGSIGLLSYLSPSATNAPVQARHDNFRAVP